jgi:hypothetical protein
LRNLRLCKYQLLAAILPAALSPLSTTFAGALALAFAGAFSLTFARLPTGPLIGLLAVFVRSASSLALSRAWSLARRSCPVSSWHNATSLIDDVAKS